MTSFKGQKDLDRKKVFWSKVNKSMDDECWIWSASTNKDGYGQFWIGHTFVPAHRYSWELTRRCKVPEGKYILHLCDNPPCCNPNHLICGDAKLNAQHRMERCPKVPAHISASPKLWKDDIIAIREMLKLKIPQWKIAQYFKVDQSTISHINTSKEWLCKEDEYV